MDCWTLFQSENDKVHRSGITGSLPMGINHDILFDVDSVAATLKAVFAIEPPITSIWIRLYVFSWIIFADIEPPIGRTIH